MATSWIDSLHEVEKYRSSTDGSRQALERSIIDLNQALDAADKGEIQTAYASASKSWGELLNATERLSTIGLLIAEEGADTARLLVGGTVIELVQNLLLTGELLTKAAGKPNVTDALAAASGQPRLLEAAQRLVSVCFPDDAPSIKRQFEQLDLPVSGFPGTVAITQPPIATYTPPAAQATLNILHISDIHRTSKEIVENYEVAPPLLRSIKDLDKQKIDLMVVSGDITQSATAEQYVDAEKLLTVLCDKLLDSDRTRCIVVPGNHDIDWAQVANVSFQVTRGDPPKDGSPQPGLLHVTGGYAKPDAAALTAATQKNFRDFYARFFGRNFDAGAILEPNGTDIGVILVDTTFGMHSLIDHCDVSRELLESATAASFDSKRQTFIAVGHHGPVTKRLQHDGLAHWVFEKLLQSKAILYMHGHTHESVVWHYSVDGAIQLPSIAVGSLVAGHDERPEGSPRHYQIVRLPLAGKRGHVLVRGRTSRDGPWRRHMQYGSLIDPTDMLTFHLR